MSLRRPRRTSYAASAGRLTALAKRFRASSRTPRRVSSPDPAVISVLIMSGVCSSVGAHRAVSAFKGATPAVAADAFVVRASRSPDLHRVDGALQAPSATVVGDVSVGEGSSVWYGTVLRGDVNKIAVGRSATITAPTAVDVRVRLGLGVCSGHTSCGLHTPLAVRCRAPEPCVLCSNTHIGDRTVVHVASETGSLNNSALSTIIGRGVSIGKRSSPRRIGA